MSWNADSAKEAIQQVVAKATTDAAFRALVLKDVSAAVKQLTGNEIPASFKLQAVDASGYQATFVLPPLKGAEGELADSELEAVAGGSKSGANDFLTGFTSVFTIPGMAVYHAGEEIGSEYKDLLNS